MPPQPPAPRHPCAVSRSSSWPSHHPFPGTACPIRTAAQITRRPGDLDDIAAKANDTPFGLGAGIWTRDISKAHALAKKLRAGSVYVNCYNVFDAALPFGGYKQSGWGREMGHEVLENYTEVKAVTTLL